MQNMQSKYTNESRIKNNFFFNFFFFSEKIPNITWQSKGQAPQKSLGTELRGKLGAPVCIRLSFLIF